MLTLAGTAVAMGGAHPDATASAHLVAPDLADDGVATALEALLSLRLGTS
jgi:hydroxymethylpyrimidine pyrophosphatase-like HAD family hydrolase